MNRRLLFLLAALAAAPALPPPAAAQLSAPAEERAFDYDPGAEAAKTIRKHAAETVYEDAYIVNHPVYGAIVISKYRWKNWVTRALYLTLLNIALLAIILSLSRAEEHNLIIGYILSGVSATLAFWIFLCAALIFMINSGAWIYVLPVSLALGAATWFALMKIKKSDISLSELKESFQKMRETSSEDPRLASVSGEPGEWQDLDFVK